MSFPIRSSSSPRPRALTVILLAGACVAAALAGCGQKSDVLAVVGDREITAEEFNRVIQGNEANYPFAPDSAKRAALQDMMRRELLLVEALKRGFADDPAAQVIRKNAEERILVDALYAELAPADVPVSDAEVETFYAWRDSASRLMVVYTPDKAAAEQALAALKRGEPFGEVSNRYSLPGVLPNGGDLGYRLAGDLVDPLDEVMRTAARGAFIGPLQAPTEGWFVLTVTDRIERPKRPLEEEKPNLMVMLKQRKQRDLATKAFTMLRERYKITPAPGGAQAMFTYFNQNPDGTAQPDSALLATPLATLTEPGKAPTAYTFGEAMTDFEDASRPRPNVTLLPAIERWVENQMVRRAALLEARRRKLHEEPETVRKIDNEVHGHLVDGLFTVEVMNAVSIDEADMRAAHAAHPQLSSQPFESLPPMAQQNLYNQVAALETEARFVAFTDSLARVTKPYQMFPERLAKLPWNAAPTLDTEPQAE